MPYDFSAGIDLPFDKNGISFSESKKFIPYYVGKDAKFFSRIRSHSNLSGDVMKYTRFEMSYMNKFFYGNGFPINYIGSHKSRPQEVGQFATKKPNCLAYFNDDSVLRSIYRNIQPIGSKGHWPIQLQCYKGAPLFDSFHRLISCFQNFFFCYSHFSNYADANNAEASTFWALKGFTLSQIKKNHIHVNVSGTPTCSYLFRNRNHQTSPFPPLALSSYFTGY